MFGRINNLLIHLVIFLALPLAAHGVPQGFVFQGQIVKPDLTTLQDSNVDFKIQVLSPGTESCVLYEESYEALNMEDSAGLFSFTVGQGNQTGTDFEDTTNITQALDNYTGEVTPTECAGVNSYSPSPLDTRRVRLSFDDGSGWISVEQDLQIQSTPYAQYADSVGGLQVSELIVVNSGTAAVTQANLDRVFAADTDADELRDLIDGDSTNYMITSPSASVGFNNQRVTDIGTPTGGNDATNKTYVDSNLGTNTVSTAPLGPGNTSQVLTWNGSEWAAQALPSAGNIYDGGQSEGAALSIGTTDTFGFSLLTDGVAALSIDSSQGVSLSAGLGVTGGINVGSHVNLLNQSEMRLLDSAGGEFLGFRAPASLTASTTFTFPDGDGAANQVLSTDGSGQLIWANDNNAIATVFGRTGAVVSANGDYTAGQVTNVATGDVSSTTVQTAINELDSEKLNLSGGSLTGSLELDDQNQIQFSESNANGSNFVALQAPANLGADTVWTLPAVDGTANQVLMTDGSGALSWTTTTSGDITGVTAGNGLVGGGSTGALTLNANVDDATI